MGGAPGRVVPVTLAPPLVVTVPLAVASPLITVEPPERLILPSASTLPWLPAVNAA